jgi:nucleotide-binding universal stress UspA family protein
MHQSRDMAPQRDPTLLGVYPGAARAPQPSAAPSDTQVDVPGVARTDAPVRALHAVPASAPAAAPVLRRYRIVVGIDLSEYADIVIEYALDQAARHEAPELHFLTVRETRKPSAEERKRALWERVYPALETFNRHGTDWRAQLHVRRGKPEIEIAELAADIRADLIVIGQFGLHNPRAGDKNVPNRVLQHAVCPTLVVGMPSELDTRQCPMCAAVREQTEGQRWFCTQHAGDRGRDHFVSPMTTWSGGSLMW